MACSVAGTAASFADDESWHKDPSGLGAIADFNASYDASLDSNTIDPQLTFGNPHTPGLAHKNLYMNSPVSAGLDQTFNPHPTSAYSDFPTDLNNQGMGPPYFQTIETNPPPPQYFPSPLSNIHNLQRRSVSEPPGQPPHHQQQQPPPPPPQQPGIVFHRQHHFLGNPQTNTPRPVPLKSVSRSTRQARQHPYSRPKSQQQPQQNSHRGQTMAPTSMPFPPTQPPHHSMFHIPPQPNMTMPDPSQYSLSRVCTPAPETPSPSASRSRGVNVDPNLTGGSEGSRERLVVSVSVEELRELIFESVKRAVEEGKGNDGSAGREGQGRVDGGQAEV